MYTRAKQLICQLQIKRSMKENRFHMKWHVQRMISLIIIIYLLYNICMDVITEIEILETDVKDL